MILVNNKRKNESQTECENRVGQLAHAKQEQSKKCGTDAHEGPMTVTRVDDNGTVQVRSGNLKDTCDIRQLQLYEA